MAYDFTDEMLMAFADGALEEPRFSEIAEAIESDPEIAARVEALAVGARLAKAVYGPLADRPVPAALRGSVDEAIARAEGRGSAGQPPRRKAPALPTSFIRYAMAASIAVLVAGPLAYLAGQWSAGTANAVSLGKPLGGELAALVASVPAGEERRIGGQILRPIASFDTDGRGFCREFELDGSTATVAIACRDGAEWRVAFALDTPLAGDGYAPASAIDSLETWLGTIGAGPPYSPLDEAAALKAF